MERKCHVPLTGNNFYLHEGNMTAREEAKNALDKVIEKSRVHLYKPIQIAEILYRSRMDTSLNLLDLESYRTKSKKWRDDISLPLLGRVCTSSAKFQDNLFDENAIPPRLINELGNENKKTNGAVEAYIYNLFTAKHSQLSNALNYCLDSTSADFYVKNFIDTFWNEPGLKRSLDKVYEIIVYALFSTIVDTLNFRVTLSIDSDTKAHILQPPFLEPFFYVVGNFPVVGFLEHKVAVAHNTRFWKVYHSLLRSGNGTPSCPDNKKNKTQTEIC